MAKKWNEISNDERFQALPLEDRQAARDQYFEEVVAPNVPAEEVEDVRKQFVADSDSGFGEVNARHFENLPAAARSAGGSLVQEVAEKPFAGLQNYIEGSFPKEDDSFIEKRIVKPIQKGYGMMQMATSALPAAILHSMLDDPSEYGAEVRQEAMAEMDANAPLISDPDSFKGYYSDGARSVMEMGPGMAISMATGKAAPALLQAAIQGNTSSYGEQRDAGSDPATASIASAGSGAAEAAFEMLPVSALLKRGSPIYKRFILAAGGEGVGEALTEAVQAGIEQQTITPDMTWGEAAERMKRAGIIGVGVGGTLSAPAHVADAVRSRKANAADPGVTPITGTGETISAEEAVAPEPLVPEPADDAEAEIFAEMDREAEQRQAEVLHEDVPQSEIEEVINTDTPVEEIIQRRELDGPLPNEIEVEIDQGEGTDSEGVAYMDQETGEIRYPGQEPASVSTPEGLNPEAGTVEPIAVEPLDIPPPIDPDSGIQAKPVTVTDSLDVDIASRQVNTQPSDAQKEAGNYKKGHMKLDGLDIAIENPEGSERSGTDPDGKPWSVKIPAAYGYIKRTEGADGDHVDVYVGKEPTSGKVYLIDQIDPDTGKFDEHKAMLGFSNVEEAGATYVNAFSDGKAADRAGSISELTMEEFKEWVKGGKTSKPFAYTPKSRAPAWAEGRTYDQMLRKRIALKKKKNPTQYDRETLVDLNKRIGSVQANRPRKTRRTGDSLLHFISDKGGMQDTGGDIAALGGREWHQGKRFVRKLINPNGMTQDDMALAAWEAGYFPDMPVEGGKRPSINALLRKMEQEMSGGGDVLTIEQTMERYENQEYDVNEYERDVDSRAEELGLPEDNDYTTEEKLEFIAEREAIQDEGGMTYENIIDNAIDIAVEEGLYEIPFETSERESQSEGSNQVAEEGREQSQNTSQEEEGGGDAAPDSEEGGAAGVAKPAVHNAKSWVIQNKSTKEVIMETTDRAKVDALNTEKYEAVRIDDYLGSLNSKPEAAPTERTEAGEQSVVPGAERISDKELAERKMDGGMKSTKPQKDAGSDGGLFDTGARNQSDMFDSQPKKAKIPGQSGEAVEVYHGSDNTFDSFDINSANPIAWFSNKSDFARSFGENITKHKVTLKNPYIIEGSGLHQAALDEAAEISDLKSQGYDGVIVKQDDTVNYAVFDTSQITSEKKASPTPAKKKEATGPYSLTEHKAVEKSLEEGEYSAEEIKQLHKRVIESKDQILEELGKFTKDQLQRQYGIYDKSLKKDAMVSQAFDSIQGDFYYSDSMSWSPFTETMTQAYERLIGKQTDQDIKAGIERRQAAREKMKERVKETAKALTNPETLEDYRTFVRQNGLEELSDDQLAAYDKLSTDEALAKRKEAAEKKAEVSGIDGTAELIGGIIETKHTKKGHDLFVVQMTERVERDKYQELNSTAKRLGGYYSSYRGGGATPGFQFTTREAAENFTAVLKGEDVKSERGKKPETRAEKMRSLGERIIKAGEESMNKERKTNTVKRANQAAGAEADAAAEIAMGKTILAIADKIENGTAGILARINHRTEIGTLNRVMRRAMYETDRKKNFTYSERQKQEGRKFNNEDARNIEYPRPMFWVDNVFSISRELGEKPGFKMLVQHLEKQAAAAKKAGEDRFYVTSEKYIKKVKEAAERFSGSMGWIAEDGVADYMRLQRLEIKNLPQIRQALREYNDILVNKPKADPIKEAERKLVGKKWDGYFPTPQDLAERMAIELEISPDHKVLEPSAGKGSLIDAAIAAGAKPENVTALEIVSDLKDILSLKGYNVAGNDFLQHEGTYDRIIMNPPFEKGADIDHVRHAYNLLPDGGKMVAIMSEGPFFRGDGKATEFRQWLDNVGGVSEKLPEGSFKSSDRSTGVNTRLVTITKDGSDTVSFQRRHTYKTDTGAIKLRDIRVKEIKDWSRKKKRISKDVAKIWKQTFSDTVKPYLVDDILDPKGNSVEGLYTQRRNAKDPADYFVFVSLNEGSANPVGAMNHEGIHLLKRTGALSREWGDLVRNAKKSWMDKYDIATRYGDHTLEKQHEEAVAEAYRDWSTNRMTVSGRVEAAFKKIQRFIRKVKEAITKQGYKTWEDVFEGIYQGDYKTSATAPAQKGAGLAYQRKQGDLRQNSFSVPDEGIMDALGNDQYNFFQKMKKVTNKEVLGATMDESRRILQDRFLGFKRIQQAIEESLGRPLHESEDVYASEEMFTGRAGEKLLQLELKHKEPILETLVELNEKHGNAQQRVEDFLYALHAPERNKQIASINPKFPDGGSGMTNQEAADIIAKAKKDGTYDTLNDVSKRIHKMLRESLDLRVKMGLLTKESAQKMRETYKHYVPLRGLAEAGMVDEMGMKSGKGYSIRGEESKRALGRESKASDLLPHIFAISEESIIRGEKNRVFQSLYNLAEKNPNPELWEVNKVESKAVLNKATGLVEYRSAPVPHGFMDDNKTIHGKINGQSVRITLHDPRLAIPIKNLNTDQAGSFVRSLMAVNRYLSTVNTGWNPEFVISNALRDIETGLIHTAKYEQKGLVKAVAKDYVKALRGTWNGVKGAENTEWNKWFREMAAAGGKVSFYKMDNINDRRVNLGREISMRGSGKKAFTMRNARGLVNYVENANQAIDNAIRLSLYKNLRERGVSKQKAAQAAKNLTVNFNKKGELGPTVNAFYLFYNASTQGLFVMLNALRSKTVQKIAGGIMAYGAAADMMNAMLSPEDDDGELIYDKIPQYEKESNLIFMDPTGQLSPLLKAVLPWDTVNEVEYIKIPMAYGYRVFHEIGRNVMAYGRGAKNGWDASVDTAFSFFNNSNPIGGSESVINFFAPTIADPWLDVAMNRDFTGRPIYKEPSQFDMAPEPFGYNAYPNTSGQSKAVSQLLNDMTGGDQYLPGVVNIPPEAMDHIFAHFTGAAGSFVSRTANAVNAAATGEPITVGSIPFARKIVGGTTDWYDMGAAYDRIRHIEQTYQQWKGFAESGDTKRSRDLMKQNRDLISMRKNAMKQKRTLSKLRKAIRAAENDKRMTEAQRTKRVENLERQRKRLVNQFNIQYLKAAKKN